MHYEIIYNVRQRGCSRTFTPSCPVRAEGGYISAILLAKERLEKLFDYEVGSLIRITRKVVQ